MEQTNGIVIVTVDPRNITHLKAVHKANYLPRHLLTNEGWELLDPFIPVEVPYYTMEEVNMCIDYMIETRWLQHPAGWYWTVCFSCKERL